MQTSGRDDSGEQRFARVSQRRLLVYTHALEGGGAERVCALLASGFAQRGWDVVLAVDHTAEANQGFLDPAVRVKVLTGGHAGSTVRLARLLAREKPDVSLSAIGVSNLKHTLAATLSGRLAHAVLSYHAFAFSEPKVLSQSSYWLAVLLSRVTARTVAVSHGLRGHLIERWRASPVRTAVIHNPVVVIGNTSRVPRAPGEPPTILAAGRLSAGKNMLGLIRAFDRIASRTDAELVILGEGDDRPNIESEIRTLGLTGRVHLAGYIASPWDFYRRAACFVSASPIESFSMVVVEALAYGLPVVCYDSAGPREVLDHGLHGTLVSPGDEGALAEAILAALKMPGDEVARRTRAKVFSVEAGLDAYRRLFEEVIAEATRASPVPGVTVITHRASKPTVP